MGEVMTLSWPSHHQQLSEGLWNMFLEKFQTDFELTVLDDCDQQNPIKSHYLLLSIFCPSIRRSNEKKFIFSDEADVDEEDLKCLVEFIYRGKIEVEEERLLSLKTAAEELGFKALVDLIDKCTRGMRKGFGRRELGKGDGKTSSKRKAKKPVKIPRLENSANALTTGGRQQRKRKLMNKDKKYFQSSDEDVGDDSDNDFSPSQDETAISDKPTRKGHPKTRTRGVAAAQNDTTRTSSPDQDKLPPLFNSEELLCTICDKKFKTKQTFRQHMRRHTYPDIVQQCPHCPFKAYNFKSKLFYHLASKHQMDLQGNLLEKTFKCPDCDFACVAEFQLKSHKIYKHGAKVHKCDMCPYASNSRADLRKHQDGVHGNKRPFMCETCGFAAKSSSNLHLHLSIHKEKVVCEICGVTVKCRGLSLHMQTVHGENRKPFHCHLCSLATRCKFNLKVHLTRVHKLSAEDVKSVLNRRNSPYLQDCNTVEAPVMTLEQTIDPNLAVPYLSFTNDNPM